ncbi:component of SufBCD complex [uncultured Jannaschia sp.]|uniref:component of SufBCD complex n=1 Tax=uncultured Jannaschia sp. TaxID=293347 RepID=UPI002617D650|nr:component of SufBCD complex [uncultured Jannaschia sp.]
MDFRFLELAFEAIDLRSFSNLWFWIALAVLWSTASHWIVGVPFDLVRRAASGDTEALADMKTLARVHARRLAFIADSAGIVIVALLCFAITSLALAGFLYGLEFAQAVLLLLIPMTLVGGITLRAARRVPGLDVNDLGNLLWRTRRTIQLIGILSIFVTSMWGMWVNLNVSVLGY